MCVCKAGQSRMRGERGKNGCSSVSLENETRVVERAEPNAEQTT